MERGAAQPGNHQKHSARPLMPQKTQSIYSPSHDHLPLQAPSMFIASTGYTPKKQPLNMLKIRFVCFKAQQYM
jgi:hypothetical protein